MLDFVLLAVVIGVAALGLLWMSPEMLRHVAARMWARAHAIDIARLEYRKMLAAIEPEEQKLSAALEKTRRSEPGYGLHRLLDPESGGLWLGWYWHGRCHKLWPLNAAARQERATANG